MDLTSAPTDPQAGDINFQWQGVLLSFWPGVKFTLDYKPLSPEQATIDTSRRQYLFSTPHSFDYHYDY